MRLMLEEGEGWRWRKMKESINIYLYCYYYYYYCLNDEGVAAMDDEDVKTMKEWF